VIIALYAGYFAAAFFIALVAVLVWDLVTYLVTHESEQWWYRNRKGARRRLDATVYLASLVVISIIVTGVSAGLALVIG
jgi:Flp pilus assembly protein TadB